MQSLTSSSHASYHNVDFCHDQNGVRSTWLQKCLVWLSRLACVYLTWLCEYGKQIDFKEKSHTVTWIFILGRKFNLNDGRGKSNLHTHTHYQFFWGCYILPPDVLYLTNFCKLYLTSEGSTPPWATAARRSLNHRTVTPPCLLYYQARWWSEWLRFGHGRARIEPDWPGWSTVIYGDGNCFKRCWLS